MITYTALPINFFEKQLNDKELYIDLYRYHVKSLKEEGFEVDGKWYSVDSVKLDKEVEKFYVPAVIFSAESIGEVRGIDTVVYAYLSLLACKSKDGSFKLNIGEIYDKTKIRKTEIKASINKLVRLELIESTKVSGIYVIEELKILLLNPYDAKEYDQLISSFFEKL